MPEKFGEVMLKTLARISVMVAGLCALVASPTIAKSNNKAAATAVAQETITPTVNTIVVSVVAKTDDRAEKLANYFASKNSPFVPYAKDFVAIADKYDIDWTLLPSITGVESSFGIAVPAFSYNPYGWNNGKTYFPSWVAATETVASGLRTRYAPTGVITPWRIGPMYAESTTWAVRVARFQSELLAYASQ